MRKTTLPIIVSLLCCACSSDYVTDLGKDWKSIEKDLQTQLITARDSSVITIPAGSYMFTRSLLMDDKRHVTIKGAGIDQTILSFALQEEGAEGLRVANGTNIVVEGFTIQDSKGDNIKVTDTQGITFRNIKSQWTGEPRQENGAYAFYPVLSKNVVVENCIAIGSSDAGIYVGQSDSVIIRNNEAYYNVAGIESENSRWVEIYGNYTHDNTGGILVFDLPGLTQNGHTTRVFENRVLENNFRNFAPEGNVVAAVPPGTGIMLLATRRIEIFSNSIVDNMTVGTVIISYDLVEALGSGEGTQLDENIEMARGDENYDPYPEEVFIHNNQYDNSYLLPTFKSDFGLLFMVKFPFCTPDVVWDGIVPVGSTFSMCIQQDESLNFGNLDAANDFAGLTTDWSEFNCEGTVIETIFL